MDYDNIWINYDIDIDIYIYIIIYIYLLLGGLEHDWIMTFHSVGNVIIPTDEHIFQRGRQTINQIMISNGY